MGFLGNILRALKGVSFRPTLEAHPQLTPVVAAMKQGNVQPALQLYQASTGDAELRYRLIEATATMFGNADTRTMLLDAWVNNTPHDPFAVLVRASWRVESAPTWYPNDPEDVADRARAANTAAAQFARAEYERIAHAMPHDPVPYALLLDLPLIFQLDGKRRLYAELMQRHPGFFSAQLAMHHALSAMWYGDHDQSIQFVRGVAQQAPVGSDLHILPAYGQFRIYIYEKFHGEGPDAAKRRLVDPAIQQEVAGALERSLWSASYRPGHWSLWARHVAAAWFSEAGEMGRLRAELEHVGDSFDENADPWNMSAATYTSIRQKVGL